MARWLGSRRMSPRARDGGGCGAAKKQRLPDLKAAAAKRLGSPLPSPADLEQPLRETSNQRRLQREASEPSPSPLTTANPPGIGAGEAGRGGCRKDREEQNGDCGASSYSTRIEPPSRASEGGKRIARASSGLPH